MSWNASFKQAIQHFQTSEYEEALKLLNKAIQEGGESQYVLYDTRAAVYEKLSNHPEALSDAKKVISLAPNRWQGYYRSSRLFLSLGKTEKSLLLHDAALKKAKDGGKAIKQLSKLKELIDIAISQRPAQPPMSVNELPTELLAEIFLLSAFDSETAQEFQSTVNGISHVCRHWRSIAFGTSSLWRTLVLHGIRPVAKARFYIQRSKNRLHGVQIRHSLHSSKEEIIPDLRRIRWQHVRSFALESSLKMSRPMLEYISSGVLQDAQEMVVHDPDKFYLAKLDTDILLSSLNSDLRTFKFELSRLPQLRLASFNGIKTLELSIGEKEGDWIYILEFLAHNLELENLKLNGNHSMSRFMPAPTDENLSLQHVHRLHLQGMTRSVPFFDRITFPALRELTLISCGSLLEKFASLNTEPTHLTHLDVQGCYVRNEDINSLLSSSVDLVTLRLNHIGDAAREAVERLSSTTAICPSLQHLDLSSCPDLTTSPLHRLVKDRLVASQTETKDGEEMLSVKPLLSLRVDECPRIEVDLIPWFRSRVKVFSCIYLTRKAASYRR